MTIFKLGFIRSMKVSNASYSNELLLRSMSFIQISHAHVDPKIFSIYLLTDEFSETLEIF